MILNENVDRKVIPIAGGKGGVGKSVVATNLALSIAMNGKRTVLVDLDLGGSNIHTLLGEKNIKPGIGNFISKRRSNFNEIISPTEWENLFYIPGDVLVYGLGELEKSVKQRIIKSLMLIEADYIIIDLGGGTNFTVLDFFLISNSGLVVTTAQPTSILNAYSFLRNYAFRFLQRAFSANKEIVNSLKKMFREKSPEERRTLQEVVEEISLIDSVAGEKALTFIEVLQPKIILNKVNDSTDIAMAEGLRDLCEKNLSLNIECLGTIMNSPVVEQSVDILKPCVVAFPDQITSIEINRIAQKIIQSSQFPEMPLELDYYSDSFELVLIETENDLATMQEQKTKNKNQDVGEADVNKLLELIRLQQNKIQELNGTLRMLSMGK